MKKKIILILSLITIMGLFTGCGEKEPKPYGGKSNPQDRPNIKLNKELLEMKGERKWEIK